VVKSLESLIVEGQDTRIRKIISSRS